MKKPLIIANWKMNPLTRKEAVLLAQEIEEGSRMVKDCEVVIAPPFPFLESIGAALKKSKLGAQNVFWEARGAYTGEISWDQVTRLKVRYVIVGHSERRIRLGETDEMVNKKVRACAEHGLMTVLCIGERERTGAEIPSIVGDQLRRALAGVKTNALKNLVVAYEPVWAISTNPGARADTPDNAFRARMYIKRILTELYGRHIAEEVRIIYGGSVNSTNISAFLEEGKMDGALVGGASLDRKEFLNILKAASDRRGIPKLK
ncbi:MAG: triosephosphate isomerase (TIM) [Parcubacteria group bacterium Gr01-1014_33]|nr:MAG: triosephosphate isomerase (TIM) [Parcubacteria group bacterium Gr01-1014_33]